MNAIRRDEELDNLHSVYVDQWDWEKVITPDTRNLTTLRNTVTAIVGCVCNTLDVLKARYNFITTELSRDVFFITTQELLDMYPDKTPKERENAITKEHRTVFIMQIGDLLSNGEKHDGYVSNAEVQGYTLQKKLENQKTKDQNRMINHTSLFYGDENANNSSSSSLLSYKWLQDDDDNNS